MTLPLKPWLAGIALLALVAILGLYLPGLRVLFYLGKPLATLAIIVLALRLRGGEPGYRRGIVTGLLFGLVGDVLLMLDGEIAFMAGLGSFLLGHLAYLHAYRQRAPLFAAAWPFAAYALLAGVVLAWLWPALPHDLRVPVLVYVAVLAAMAAQAAAVWWRRRDAATACAAIGGACFLASDAILAVDRFALPFVAAPALLLALYWLAQALIALSVRR
ncbi:MAG TPA: lysoplasmalogenase [Thermomonas sp.]|nr:lysoplasmalogenase [Thermomonas sp.]